MNACLRRTVAAVLFAAVVGFAAGKGKERGHDLARELLVGRWAAELILPNGIRVTDDQLFRPDGIASGHIIVYFRDGTVKSSNSYNLFWRLAGKILITAGIVRVPAQPELPNSGNDEVLRLDANGLVLKDLSNGIVVSYKRVGAGTG